MLDLSIFPLHQQNNNNNNGRNKMEGKTSRSLILETCDDEIDEHHQNQNLFVR